MKIQLKRSNVLDGGSAKEPTSAQMEYGELAVNYNSTDPSLFIKDSSDNIVKIGGLDLDYLKSGDNISELNNDVGYITSADLPPSQVVNLGYTANGNNAGTVTNTAGNNATIPIATNTVAGLFTGSEKQKLSSISSGANVGLTSVNLGYTANGDSAGTVTNTGGNNATIPIATNSVAGLFTGSEKQKLSGLNVNSTNDARYLRKDLAAGVQAVQSPNPVNFNGGIGLVGGTEASVRDGIIYRNGGTYITNKNVAHTRFSEAGIRYTGSGDADSVAANVGRIFDGYRSGGSNNQKINNQFNATYQDSDLSATKFQTVVQARPGILGNQTVTQGGITCFEANATSLDSELLNVSAFRTNLSRANSTTDETKFVLNSSGTASSYHRGKFYFASPNPDLYRYNTQNDGIKLIVNSTTECPVEVSSTNTGNNNAKTAISFSKIDFNKSPGQADYISEAGFIQINGNVGASAGMVYSCGANSTGAGFVSTSDYRLKTDITEMPSAVDRLKLLQPKTYKWIGTDEVVDGFLAHEVTPACSAAVFGQKDAVEQIGTITNHTGVVVETDVTEPSPESLEYTEEVEVTPAVAYSPATYDEDGNELTPAVEPEEPVTQTITHTKTWTPTGTRPAYQSIDQTKLIPLLTKALQEALERIEALEAAQ